MREREKKKRKTGKTQKYKTIRVNGKDAIENNKK